ncbi:MAG: GGDEF domain-containing protein [Myxococcota bacterium]
MDIGHRNSLGQLPTSRLVKLNAVVMSAALSAAMTLFALMGQGAWVLPCAAGLAAVLLVSMFNANGTSGLSAWASVALNLVVALGGVWFFGVDAGTWLYVFATIPLFAAHVAGGERSTWVLVGAFAMGAGAVCTLAPGGEVSVVLRESLFIVNAVASFVAAALGVVTLGDSHRRVHRDAVAIAYEDALTSLPNRRALDELLARYQPFDSDEPAVAVIDIDHFKSFNDRFGHACGDAVLRHVAEVMRTVVRSDDIIGRWGGEEFVAILRNSDGARFCLERMRYAIENTPLECSGHQHRVRVTIGAVRTENGEEVLEALARADHALYEGKNNGRNRVEWAEIPRVFETPVTPPGALIVRPD